jgi:PAS domain S-box-containing protein
MFIAFVSAGAALLFAMVVLAMQQWLAARAEMALDMNSHAQIVSMNSTSAMLFGDQRAAAETMGALAAIKEVEFAEIHGRDGRPFASYARPGVALPPRHAIPAGDLHYFSATHLDLFHPIVSDGVLIGTIHINASLAPLYAEIFQNAAFLLAVMLGGLAVAWMLTSRLHPLITGPISGLIGLMDRVSSEKNYALRAMPGGKDELGKLAGEFNGMLGQIQARDEVVAQHEAHLEQEVAHRTARLREAQRIAHIGNWEWDIVDNTLIWSDEIYRIFGLAPQQFGATYEAFLQAAHPEDRQLVDACVREALEQRHPYSIDHRILLPDGTVRHVHEQAEVSRGEDGQPVGMLGTVQDITDAKLAEATVERLRREMELILEAAGEGICTMDPNGNHVLVNPSAARMFGYEVEEMIGRPSHSLWHYAKADGAAYPAEECPIHATLRDGVIHRSESEVFWRKDGTSFPVEYVSTPIRSNGVITGVVVVFHDITERKLAEDRIRESEARYRGIFENANDIIYLLEPDGTFRSLSPAFERITGWSAEEWIGKPFAPIIHPDDGPYANDIFARTLSGESVPSFRLRIARKSGTYFDAELSITPLGSNGATVALGIARDVTERKLAEEKVRQLNEELEIKVQKRTSQLLAAQEELVRKEKLAVLGQVAGSVGHELRNPLGVMSNAVYFLQTVLSDADETTREYLGIIKGEIATSEHIVADLLDSVRTKPPRPEAVSVEELIGQILGKSAIPPTVTVRLDIPSTIPPLRVDAMQIHQVIRNLISNGVEAMPEGGALEIRAAENEAAKSITVSVRDTGTGIAPEQMALLFQPLYTTKARGIGLGLVVVKNLTEANGGSIEVQSEPGKGTTFSVTLPSGGPTM